MNSLLNYGTDDDSEDSGDHKQSEMQKNLSRNYRRSASQEDNYEEVGMDMSEDSDEDEQPKKPEQKPPKPSAVDSRPLAKSSSSSSNSSNDGRGRSPRDHRNSRDRDRSTRDDRGRPRGGRDDDRGRDRGRDSRNRDDRRDRRDERSNRDDRYGRERYDRDRRRSRSKEKRRSRSRDRGYPRKSDGAAFRMDRMDRADKPSVEMKPNGPSETQQADGGSSRNNTSGNRFFMPGITGRFRDQIEKRKLLWQKGKEENKTVVQSAAPSGFGVNKCAKVYEATTFADDKTSSKFKRLMGIRDTGAAAPAKSTSDVLKKQEEMFSSMEAQYEVARTATHTMRGVGLGFGSFQR